MEYVGLEALMILQERDIRIVALNKRLKAIPEQRTALQMRIANLKARALEAKKELLNCEASIKQLELETASKKALIAKILTQQEETKKNEEYEAFNREIQYAKDAIEALELQELAKFEELPTLEEAFNKLKQMFEKIASTLEADLAAFDKAVIDDTATLKTLLEERKTRRATIKEALVALYERVGKGKGLPVVLEVGLDGSCPKCHRMLTTAHHIKIKSHAEIVQCGHCDCILF